MLLRPPSESDSHSHPTTPSSGSARNLQSLPRRIFPPPNPVPPPAARSPAQPSLSPPSRRSRSPLSLRPRLPNPSSHPHSRCPPPTQWAPPRNSQSFHRSSFHPVSSRAERGICFCPLPPQPPLLP